MVQDHRIEGIGEVEVDDLLALLDADNVHDVGPDEVGFSCFYIAGHSHGDQNPSAHINRDSLLWRCKGCGRSGNLLELVKLALPIGTTHPEALAWLREHFGEVVRKPRGGSLGADLEMRLARARVSHPTRRLPNEAETIGPEGIFHVDWRSDHEAAVYMRSRGFDPDVLEEWGFGYDTWSRRVAIPVRNEDGILVGFKGRAIDGRDVKYMLLGDTEGARPRYGMGYGFQSYDHNSILFGLDRARRHKPPFVLCEGELDAVACHAAGLPAVASGTKSVSRQQLWLLRAHTSSLTIFYDSDDPGQDAVWGFVDDEGKFHQGLVERISAYLCLYVVDDHEGDAASMGPQEAIRLVYEAKHWLRYSVPSGASV
jgi:DNA primase